MSTSPEAIEGTVVPGHSLAADLLRLTKPGILLMALVMAAFGFLLGAEGRLDLPLLLRAMLAIALVGGACTALNMAMEWRFDARMARTAARPIPAGRLGPREAVLFGAVLGVAGLGLLAWTVNLATFLLAGATGAIYLLLYTPLKRRTPLCTLVGAVPGALPPVLGWTAAAGAPGAGAWALFAILFFWQLPHFLPISWIYREDYAAGGFRMLSLRDEGGGRTGWASLVTCAALLAASLAPAALGLAGWVYLAGALGLGAVFLAFAAGFALVRTRRRARLLFFASLAYLPLLMVFMAADHVGEGV